MGETSSKGGRIGGPCPTAAQLATRMSIHVASARIGLLICAFLQTDDVAWVIVLATKPAVLITQTTEMNQQKHQVDAGLNRVCFPLEPGGGMKAVMIRNNIVVAECTPIGYRFEERPGVYNFNAYVSMSS